MYVKFKVTRHAIQRIIERYPDICKDFPEILEFKSNSIPRLFKPIFNELMKNCTENNSYLNNSARMVNMYEKYGYESDLKYAEHEKYNLVFVLRKNRTEECFKIVTTMPKEYVPTVKNIKFNHVKRKDGFEIENMENLDVLYNFDTNEISNFIKNKEQEEKSEMLTKQTSQHIKDQLFKAAENQKANFLEKISNTRMKYGFSVEGVVYEYEFNKNSKDKLKILNKKDLVKRNSI